MSVKESYAGKINRKLNKKLRVIAVAAGREPADLVLKTPPTSTCSPTSCVTAISPWRRDSS